MPCTYVSENVPNMKNLKTLCKALDKMGLTYKVHQIGNAAVIESRTFRIELHPTKGATVDRADGSSTWINNLKQRYSAEAGKMMAKKKGYFVKETTLADGRIELSLSR